MDGIIFRLRTASHAARFSHIWVVALNSTPNFHHPASATASDCYYPKLQRRLILQTIQLTEKIENKKKSRKA
jgi:hypothetical protein